jgi:hypothetical protein
MQESLYNESGPKFYDESIAALSKEKKRLEFRLQMLQENKAVSEKITFIFTGIFVFVTIVGVVLLVYHPFFKFQSEKFGIYYFVIFGLLLLTAVYRIIGMDKTGADIIAADILEIERKIFEMEKKASHEERALNATNSKPKSEPVNIHSVPKPTTLASDEKYCPVCAETIKATSIYCNFCGYRF